MNNLTARSGVLDQGLIDAAVLFTRAVRTPCSIPGYENHGVMLSFTPRPRAREHRHVTPLRAPRITRRPRSRGAGRPAARSTRSSARSGDSGDDGPSSPGDPDGSPSTDVVLGTWRDDA